MRVCWWVCVCRCTCACASVGLTIIVDENLIKFRNLSQVNSIRSKETHHRVFRAHENGKVGEMIAKTNCFFLVRSDVIVATAFT